jgi:putative hydrolase of the HAD superfamily
MKIVFDFGGVLFRWQPERLLREVLPQRATDAASATHWARQVFQSYGGDWGEFDRGTVEPAALVQRIARRTGLTEAEVQRVVDAVPHELQPQPDTVALLRRLHAAGRALYFLSNMPAPYADHLQAAHDFMGLFTDGVFSGRVHHNKPEPAIFELAAARFGGTPASLFFIDDHAPNVQAAQALGWQGTVFTSAAQLEAALRACGLMDTPD